jgi:ATP-dependent DNA helicase RecG
MEQTLAKKTGRHVIDLLRHLPVSVIDRTARPSVDEAEDGQIATFEILVLKADLPPPRARRPARITAETASGQIELIFFHAHTDYLKTTLPVGERRLISGRLERFQGRLQMPHPDFVLPLEKADNIPQFEPVYSLTAGLKTRTLTNAIKAGLEKVPELVDWIDPELLAERGWPSFKSALLQAHAPTSLDDVSPTAPARARLAYDELLANQLALQFIRQKSKLALPGRAIAGTGKFTEKLLPFLPFTPTSAQQRVIAEITAEQSAPDRMLRLLQGDVGSGKTFVALMTMLTALESGAQAALLAPTEILARQHYQGLSKLLKPLGLTPVLLTGTTKQKARRDILQGLADGGFQIAIGTHALLSDEVVFADLALAVVDEQHRFGVRQRLVLGQKGKNCDVLVMTATPIPRTLAMTAYGDLAVSRLDEKPAGRGDIETALLSQERLAEITTRLAAAIKDGQRAYWICPLIEETDKLDAAAAEDRHRALTALLPEANPVLAHGKMKAEKREEAMSAFKDGTSKLLVATTVIEVGVDVPEASIIIIEHAERFGLSQLHQLRGRVGRGDRQSSCILMYQPPLNETARSRLRIMRQTNDGFVIAEEDLRLRGPGEILGQRQSGIPEFCLADLAVHGDLLSLAHQQAEKILLTSRNIDSPEMAKYALLLSLFERDCAVQFLNSG